MTTGAAQTTGTITMLTAICKAWEANKAGGAEEPAAAADCFSFDTEAEKAQFISFYAGYISGMAHDFTHHPHDTTHAARIAHGLDTQPGTAKRRASATKQAIKAIDTCAVFDTDAAATIYNAVREQRPSYPLEFILGDIYCAGIAIGREREQAKQRRNKTLPEAVRITTNESPADRESRSAAATENAARTKYAPITDADSAAIVYNLLREADRTMPFTFLLGQVYAAGKMEATHAEQERRRKKTAG